jgi:hypothetical protein
MPLQHNVVAKSATAVGQDVSRLLREPNIPYQHWTFSEPNMI